MLSSYHQFLIALIIVGYFLANILEGIAYLDYILFAVLTVLVVLNAKSIKKFLKGK
jgi:hypothetical protein